MPEGEPASPARRPAWWPLGRGRREPAAGVASTASPVAAPGGFSAEPTGAWRDLPRLQRTLAEPLRPVAVGDDFRKSLASFNDPSFVAPLSHQVDPSAGGLVDGLAAPGRPYAHPSDPELPVPARPAAPAAPRVQRTVAWSGSTDLPTVGWELPGLPADEPMEPNPESPPMTDGRLEPSAPVPAPVSSPTPAGAAGQVAAAPTQTRLPVQRSLAAVPTSPVPRGVVPPISLGELPVVVARLRPDVPPPEGSTPEVHATTHAPNEAPSRPVAEQAPLSGFAQAITRPGDSDEVPAEPPVGPAGGDDQPAAGPAIQRMSAGVEAPVGSDSIPDGEVGVTPNLLATTPGSGTLDALPVVSRLADPTGPGDSSPPPRIRTPGSAGGDPTRRSDDAPTLGMGLAHQPLAVQRAPLTGRTALPVDPPAQPVEFLIPQFATTPSPSMTRMPAAAPADAEPIAESATDPAGEPPAAAGPTPGISAAPPVQRSWGLPPQAGVVAAGVADRPGLSFPAAPVAVQRSAADWPVREAPDEAPATSAVAETTESVVPAESGSPPGPPDLPVPAAAHDRRELADPSAPAVTAERWVPAVGVAAQASGQTPSVQRLAGQPRFAPAPSVQTSLNPDSPAPDSYPPDSYAPAPFGSAAPATGAYPSRPVGSSPTVAVGPPLAVQRSAAHSAEASSTPSAPAPLVVSRQVAANVPPGSSLSGANMSFASMFGSAAVTRSAEPAATGEEGFTSVQLQAADTGAAPIAPAGESATPAAASAAPAPAAPGTPSTDLDEMARRLYEPLSARLRAELWLDRERAGVMSDA